MQAQTVKERIPTVFAFITLALIYIAHAPHTVQTGDSAELTASAFKLLVAHPPGYPLWIWLNHFWINLISIHTHFFSFSLFNILTTLIALWVMSKCISSNLIKPLSVITLGLSYFFWRFTELPEVFMLNVLLAFLVIYFGKSTNKIRGTKIPVAASIMPLCFSLGIAHHLTIIYLLPFVLYICWKNKYHLSLYISIGLGVILSTALYASIQLMHPEHIYSWGNISDIKAVWEHFLRKDYGTFSLHSTGGSSSSIPIVIFFFKNLLLSTLPLIALTIFAIKQKLQSHSKIIISGWEVSIWISILLYITLFIGIMQVELFAYWIETTARFFILPISLSILCLGIFTSRNFVSNSLKISSSIACIFIFFGCYNYLQFSNNNDFSENTIIEDLSINLLNISSEFSQPFVFLGKDNFIFPTRYMQIVENLQTHVIASGNITLKFPIFTKKLSAIYPDFKAPTDVTGLTIHSLSNVLISPNAEKFTFIAMEDLYPPTLFKLTYLPVGFIISPGTGIEFHKSRFTPQFRSDSSILQTPLNEFDQFRDAFSQYTIYFMLRGFLENENGNTTAAIDSYERALGIAPFMGRALVKICELKNKEKISDNKCNYVESVRDHFDYYGFNRR